MKLKIFFLVVLGISVLTCCKDDDEKKAVDLPGGWYEIASTSGNADSIVHRFYFTCVGDNHFNLEITTYTNKISENNSCFNKPYYVEYVVGTYSLSGDNLTLSGNYCDENGNIVDQNYCYNYGPYDRNIVCSYDGNVLTMTVVHDGYGSLLNFRKTQALNCN